MSRRETVFKNLKKEKELMENRVKHGIESYRKGDFSITLKNSDGDIIDGNITVDLIDHEFKFGANIFMLDEFEKEEKNSLYREKFSKICNLATIPIYWSDLEPTKGQPRYRKDSKKIYRRPNTDLCLEYCMEKRIEPKCHCLNYDNFVPEWAFGLNVVDYKIELEKRFKSLSENYAHMIPSWEVTNETFVPENAHKHTGFYYEPDFIEWSFKTADKYFPNNKLIINDYLVWDWLDFHENRSQYYMQIERLLQNKSVHLDSIGFQLHNFAALEDEEKYSDFRFKPSHFYNVMDRYSDFGKKLQITEMTISAYGNDAENEEIQAEILKNYYSMFFSHPNMEAVIYWNLVDGYAAFAPLGDMSAGENRFHGGLIDFNMREKPAFKMLDHLINKEWHSNCTIDTKNGIGSFRGFYGKYTADIIADGKKYQKEIEFSKQGLKNIDVIL